MYKNQNKSDSVYPNGIHCSNKQHCVAVLEGDGVRIIVTRDGGQTWKETMRDNDPHSSLLAVRMVSDTEVWVAGGQVSGKQEGRLYHSVDGGDTWKMTSFPNTYIVSLDMKSPHLGYAVALTTSNPAGVKLLKYSA